MVDVKSSQNHNNLFVTEGFRLDYIIPLGNFFKIGYLFSDNDFSDGRRINLINDNAVLNPDRSIRFQPYLFEGSAINWEFRYPVKVFSSTRGKIYFASFLDELHLGFTGRELSIAGSVFDFRFNALISSPVRERQYLVDVIIQKVFDYWSFSSIAIGPSVILGTLKDGDFGFTSIFINVRFKMGTSL